MARHLALAALVALFSLSCSGSLPGNPDAVAVNISPEHVRVTLANTVQFTATVTGTMDRAVDWTTLGAQCSGRACGMIDANGLYTAPDTLPDADAVTVRARSRADPNAAGEASVAVASFVSVEVNPASRLILSGGTQRFNAVVNGSPNTGVWWTIDGDDCDDARCGTIDEQGFYRAPEHVTAPKRLKIVAVPLADPNRPGLGNVSLMSSTVIGGRD